MLKYELSYNMIKEIKESWKLLVGSSEDLLHEDNLQLALKCIGLNLKDEELIRLKKDKNYFTSSYTTSQKFIEIVKIKFKQRNLDKDIDNIILAFKDKQNNFTRSNINFQNIPLSTERNKETEITCEELLEFCEFANITTSIDDIRDAVFIASEGKDKLSKSDLRYIYKKTHFI